MGTSPAGSSREIIELGRVAGVLCLDFTNTVGWRGTDHAVDYLTRYADLAWWAHSVGIWTRKHAAGAAATDRQHPQRGERVLRRAVALRETVYRVVRAAARGGKGGAGPVDADIDGLNAELSRAMSHLSLTPGRAAFTLGFVGIEEALDAPLWHVARSAGDLLTSDRIRRVKECVEGDCHWLFVDVSRNHSRRWCDMRDCGNRAKARRHYAKQRAQA